MPDSPSIIWSLKDKYLTRNHLQLNGRDALHIHITEMQCRTDHRSPKREEIAFGGS